MYFGEADLELFRTHIQDARRHTEIVEAGRPADLRIDLDGKVFKGQYNYSVSAFIRLANKLALSLSQVVRDIAGYGKDRNDFRSAFSFDDAASIFNKVLERRFGTHVAGYQIVLNTKDKLIEGVVSPAYHYVDNLTVYERAMDALDERRLRFGGGAMIGRRMGFRLLGKEPMYTLPLGNKSETFYSGYHVGNGEAGDSSVRAGAVLYRHTTGGMAFDEAFVRRGRVRHVGKNFERRIAELFSSAAEKVEKLAWTRAKLLELQDQPLNFGLLLADIERKTEWLVSKLYRLKVPRSSALTAVQFAYNSGASVAPSFTRRPSAVEIASRTAYDLADGLMSAALTLSPGDRERVEQVAFDLMTDFSKLRR